jgi:hypothetical protein
MWTLLLESLDGDLVYNRRSIIALRRFLSYPDVLHEQSKDLRLDGLLGEFPKVATVRDQPFPRHSLNLGSWNSHSTSQLAMMDSRKSS